MTGPYVITTTRTEGLVPHEHPGWTEVLSRVAVATLRGNDLARGLFNWRKGDVLDSRESLLIDVIVTARLPRSGGTIGPLPDGTVIEVKPISRAALADSIIGHGLVWPAKDEDALRRQCDAFNAQGTKR